MPRDVVPYEQMRTVTHQRCGHHFPRLQGWCGQPSQWVVFASRQDDRTPIAPSGACDEHLGSAVAWRAEEGTREVEVSPYWRFMESYGT